MSGLVASQISYGLFILVLFIGYGSLVRRGVVSGKGIIGAGVVVTLLATAAAAYNLYPAYRSGQLPLVLFLFNPLLMTFVSALCVFFSYRQQQTEDLVTLAVGDSKIIVRFCPPARIPDADALLLPTVTTLRMLEGLAGSVGMGAGRETMREATRHAPVNLGKVVTTGPGQLAVGRIYHVAVGDPLRPVDEVKLRRGMESAAQQARKGGAESVAVPVGSVRGLTLSQSVSAIAGGVLRHHKPFAEIVFVVFEPRHRREIAEVIQRLVEVEEPPKPPLTRRR